MIIVLSHGFIDAISSNSHTILSRAPLTSFATHLTGSKQPVIAQYIPPPMPFACFRATCDDLQGATHNEGGWDEPRVPGSRHSCQQLESVQSGEMKRVALCSHRNSELPCRDTDSPQPSKLRAPWHSTHSSSLRKLATIRHLRLEQSR